MSLADVDQGLFKTCLLGLKPSALSLSYYTHGTQALDLTALVQEASLTHLCLDGLSEVTDARGFLVSD